MKKYIIAIVLIAAVFANSSQEEQESWPENGFCTWGARALACEHASNSADRCRAVLGPMFRANNWPHASGSS